MSRLHRAPAASAALVILVAVYAGCAAPRPSGPTSAIPSTVPSRPPASGSASPSASPAGSPTVAEARIADLAFLVERLKAIHRNPFLDEGEAGFMARVAAIEERAAGLTDAGFLVAVMDLMGHRDRDGHSGAWAMAQQNGLLTAWPVWLWDFPDGLRVVAAKGEPGLIGARVTRVGHLPVAEARTAVEPLVPRDNASSLRANLPMYLLLPEVLTELGVLAPGDPGLTVERLDGSTSELTTAPIALAAYRDWVFGAYGGEFPEGLPPDEDGPPHLRQRDQAFWSETLPDPAAIYFGYNVVARTSGGRLINALATSLETDAKAHPDLPVVIDLRNNGGGDNTTFAPLRRVVESIAGADPGRVRLITGRSTFSAAGNFVTDLLVGPQRAGIRLVGEAPGGGLNIYGDVDVVTLPASKIVVLVSGDYHERAPGDDRLAIEPDRPAEVTWADYAAGRDPVLEAAINP